MFKEASKVETPEGVRKGQRDKDGKLIPMSEMSKKEQEFWAQYEIDAIRWLEKHKHPKPSQDSLENYNQAILDSYIGSKTASGWTVPAGMKIAAILIDDTILTPTTRGYAANIEVWYQGKTHKTWAYFDACESKCRERYFPITDRRRAFVAAIYSTQGDVRIWDDFMPNDNDGTLEFLDDDIIGDQDDFVFKKDFHTNKGSNELDLDEGVDNVSNID